MGTPGTPAKKATCNGHEKSGIPILPLRYGLVTTLKGNEDLPPISADAGIPIEKDSASFTWRVLHEGFLYVYLGKQKQLDEYLVSQDGYFMLIKPGTVNLPVFPAFSCVPQHSGSAGIITVPFDSEDVWIGFSDVRWTPDVRAQNAKPEIRDKHMRKVSPKDWPKSKDWRHCFTVKQIESKVAEFKYSQPRLLLDTEKEKSGLFLASPFTPKSRFGWAKYMTDTCEKMAPGTGFAVALNDPVATASEMSALMAYRADNVFEGDDKVRLVASAAIDNLREIVHVQKQQAVLDADEVSKNMAQETSMNVGGGFLLRPDEVASTLPEPTAPEMKNLAANEWKKYNDKKFFDDKARTDWHSWADPKIKEYNAKYIASLDKALADFLQANVLNLYLLHNFDRHNIDSGAVYVECVYRCIAGIQDKVACAAMLVKYLCGDIKDASRNFLINALSWNQEELQKAIAKEEAKESAVFEGRQVGWDNIIATYGMALDRLKSGNRDAVGKIVIAVAGIMFKYMEKVLDGTAKSRAVIINLGVIGKAPVVLCKFEGSRTEFRRLLVKTYLKNAQSSLNLTERQLNELVNKEMNRQKIIGQSIPGTNKFLFYLIGDSDTAKALNMAGKSADELAKTMVGNVVTTAQLEARQLASWRATVSNSAVAGGIITAAFQMWMLTKLIDDDANAMQHDKKEARTRMIVGGLGLAATVFDTAATPFVAAAERNMLTLGRLKGVLKYGGKIAGLVVGLTMAVMDGIKAYELRNEGETELAGWYGASSLVGGISAIVFALAALGRTFYPGFLLFLVIAAVFIGVMIGSKQPNKLQEWLRRTPWGSASDKYETPEKLKNEFELALKG